jgi:hypothetical protein
VDSRFEFCQWLKDQSLIGLWHDDWAFSHGEDDEKVEISLAQLRDTHMQY